MSIQSLVLCAALFVCSLDGGTPNDAAAMDSGGRADTGSGGIHEIGVMRDDSSMAPLATVTSTGGDVESYARVFFE